MKTTPGERFDRAEGVIVRIEVAEPLKVEVISWS